MVNHEAIKMGVIAGAATAMKYKDLNPRASESEVMSHVTNEMRKIIRNIESESD